MNNMIKSSDIFFNIFIIFFLYSCGGGGSSGIEEAQNNLVSINLTGLKSPSYSYDNQTINISSNVPECEFILSLDNEESFINYIILILRIIENLSLETQSSNLIQKIFN